MSESKHTPGPWHQCGGNNWHIISNEHHMQVARTNGVVRFAPNGKSRQYDSTPEEEANACLIAAAPELLAACQEVWQGIFEHPDRDGPSPMGDMLHDAIEKATGRPPY